MSQSPRRTARSARSRIHSRRARTAAGLSTLALLTPFFLPDVQAAAVSNPTQSAAAAGWLARTNPSGGTFSPDGQKNGGIGTDADCLVGLAASGAQQGLALKLEATVKSEAKKYATSGGAAGKMAIAAASMGDDATNYGGVNLVGVINKAIAADPTMGGTFSGALAILGLARAHQEVPQAAIDALIAAQDSTGAFGYTYEGFHADADTTALAIDALSVVPRTQAVKSAIDKAVAWALKDETPTHYWDATAYSPANSTALMVSALNDVGRPQPEAMKWMLGQQARTGTGAFSNTLNGTSSNVMATCQSLMAIAGASYATALYHPLATGVVGDSTGDRIADVYAVDGSGNLRFYKGFTNQALNYVGTSATGWSNVSYIAQMSDPSGNPRSDLLVRRSDGTLWLHRSAGMGALEPGRQVGKGWGAMSAIVPVTNLAGGTTQYVVARRSDGTLWRYRVTTTGLGAGVQIGRNWNGMTAMVGTGDFTGDGRADVVAVRTDGTLWVYAGQLDGTIANGREVGHGWTGFTSVFAPGDMSGNGTRDLVGRRADGSVFVYDNLAGRWGNARQIGSGMTDLRLMA